MGLAATGEDYGLGLCHTCIKEIIHAGAAGPPNGKPQGIPAPRYAVTMAPAFVAVPVPETDDQVYNMAVVLPSCYEHLEINKRKAAPPPPAARRPLIVP
jgi:hypothetical protein